VVKRKEKECPKGEGFQIYEFAKHDIQNFKYKLIEMEVEVGHHENITTMYEAMDLVVVEVSCNPLHLCF